MTQRQPSMPARAPRPRRLRLNSLALAALLAWGTPLQSQTGAEPARRNANTPPGHSPALKSTAPVTVNFVNADVEAVTRAMAAMIERQIAIDPRVKGTVTLYSDQPLSVREAYLNYLSALRGLGFTMIENGGLLKVVPEAEAKLQTGTVSVGEPKMRGDQVLTQIFTLNHESPNNLVAVLRPLISANNTINASLGSNALVITDYADNLQRLARIIAALDRPAGSDIEVVPLKHAVAGDLAPMVQRLADGGASAPTQPGLPGGSSRLTVLVDPRSNALILRAANPAHLVMALTIIDKLDQPTQGGTPAGNIWVVYLKNADAVKLATVLRAAYTATAGSSGAGTGVAGTGAPTPVMARAGDVAGGRRRGHHAGRGFAEPVHRRLHPGRPGHELADHHRARTAVPAVAQRHRPARHAPRAGLHRNTDRQGRCREGRRDRRAVAGHLRRPEQRDQLRRRHQPGPARHRQPDHRGQLTGARAWPA